jgi:hypothetical protein
LIAFDHRDRQLTPEDADRLLEERGLSCTRRAGQIERRDFTPFEPAAIPFSEAVVLCEQLLLEEKDPRRGVLVKMGGLRAFVRVMRTPERVGLVRTLVVAGVMRIPMFVGMIRTPVLVGVMRNFVVVVVVVVVVVGVVVGVMRTPVVVGLMRVADRLWSSIHATEIRQPRLSIR